MAPEDTTITCLPASTSAAMSAASDSSQAALTSPRAWSTSRLEPILTTMRRAFAHSARGFIFDVSAADIWEDGLGVFGAYLAGNRRRRQRLRARAAVRLIFRLVGSIALLQGPIWRGAKNGPAGSFFRRTPPLHLCRPTGIGDCLGSHADHPGRGVSASPCCRRCGCAG